MLCIHNVKCIYTHGELFDPPAWSLGVVPEPELRHSARLVKYHVHTVDNVRQYWCQPHVSTVPAVVHTIYQLVHGPQITFDPWKDINALRERSNV